MPAELVDVNAARHKGHSQYAAEIVCATWEVNIWQASIELTTQLASLLWGEMSPSGLMAYPLNPLL